MLDEIVSEKQYPSNFVYSDIEGRITWWYCHFLSKLNVHLYKKVWTSFFYLLSKDPVFLQFKEFSLECISMFDCVMLFSLRQSETVVSSWRLLVREAAKKQEAHGDSRDSANRALLPTLHFSMSLYLAHFIPVHFLTFSAPFVVFADSTTDVFSQSLESGLFQKRESRLMKMLLLPNRVQQRKTAVSQETDKRAFDSQLALLLIYYTHNATAIRRDDETYLFLCYFVLPSFPTLSLLVSSSHHIVKFPAHKYRKLHVLKIIDDLEERNLIEYYKSKLNAFCAPAMIKSNFDLIRLNVAIMYFPQSMRLRKILLLLLLLLFSAFLFSWLITTPTTHIASKT